MRCPTCGAWVLVKETRQRNNNTTLRRYLCANDHPFNTEESVIDHNLEGIDNKKFNSKTQSI